MNSTRVLAGKQKVTMSDVMKVALYITNINRDILLCWHAGCWL